MDTMELAGPQGRLSGAFFPIPVLGVALRGAQVASRELRTISASVC
jgi:hypothetical protein